MRRTRSPRRFLAALLAYAVALQACLAALTAIPQAQAADSLAVICAATHSDGPAKPGHASGGSDCCVAAGCCAAAAILRGEPAAVAVPAGRVFTHGIVVSAAPAVWPSERPRSSRAPPV